MQNPNEAMKQAVEAMKAANEKLMQRGFVYDMVGALLIARYCHKGKQYPAALRAEMQGKVDEWVSYLAREAAWEMPRILLFYTADGTAGIYWEDDTRPSTASDAPPPAASTDAN